MWFFIFIGFVLGKAHYYYYDDDECLSCEYINSIDFTLENVPENRRIACEYDERWDSPLSDHSVTINPLTLEEWDRLACACPSGRSKPSQVLCHATNFIVSAMRSIIRKIQCNDDEPGNECTVNLFSNNVHPYKQI